jgi:hypothetical protein
MDVRIRDRSQEAIKFDPAPDVVDLGGRKIELIYVGDTACTVDGSSCGHRPFAMSVREYEVNLSLRSLDSLDADAGFDLNPDAPARLLPAVSDCIAIQRPEGAGAAFRRRLPSLGLVHRCGRTQARRPPPMKMTECGSSVSLSRSSEVLRSSSLGRSSGSVWSSRWGMPLINRFLAGDQAEPIEDRLRSRDTVGGRALDLVQRVARGNQHLFRRAASVRASTTKVPVFDQRDGHPCCPGRGGDRDSGVAPAKHNDVEPFGAHFTLLPART